MDDRETLRYLVARKLLESDFVSPDELASREIEEAQATRILDAAVKRGVIGAELLSSLRSPGDSNDPSKALTAIMDDPLSSPHPEPTPVLLNIDRFGRFTDLEFLGEGGMSVVFKAWDSTLDRFVALKFLRSDRAPQSDRLLFEAKAQARVDHPNVCRVYEAREIEGRPYIAMQLIEGETLKGLAPRLTEVEKARIMAEVADGVHAAHQAGLIHRDLKPSNVMVEHLESGRWAPFVMDFGLAREIEAPGMTASGTIVGTASYISPEQIRGEVLDRRCDVYGLGVSLYEILSGTLPYPGVGSLSVLSKVLHEDPISLRSVAPEVSVDLATIVEKCIDKETGARYETARELANDLRRFVEGEPIAARPASLARIVANKVRRNRVSFAVGIVASLLVIVFASIGIRERLAAKTQAEVAQRFGQQVEQIESIARFAAMLPPHDVRPEKQRLRESIRRIEDQMQALGSVAEGPGHFALGRGYLTLAEYGKAYEHLERAWKSGYQTEEVAYALGLVLGARYDEELEEARRIRSVELREARIREIEREFRDPALDHLRRVKDPVVVAPEYAEALILFYEGNWDKASARAEVALERVPWLFEAKRLQAEIQLEAATALRDRGKYVEARNGYDLADLAFQDALVISRSDAASWEGRCNLWLNVMWMSLYGEGGDVSPSRERAIESCQSAVEIDPDRASAHVRYSEAFRLWGESQVNAGTDPSEALSRARAEAEVAIQLAPDQSIGYRAIGVANQIDASWKIASGDDPEPLLVKAIDSFRSAIRVDPRDVVTFNHLGNALFYRGQNQSDRGRDPREALAAAIEAYETSLEIDPEYAAPLNNAGIAWTRIAEFQNQSGESPLASLDAAIASYDRATAINPSFTYALNNRGLAYMERGKFEQANGQDARTSFGRALAAYQAAMTVNPDYAPPHFNSTLILGYLAEIDLREGLDPSAAVEQALQSFESGLAINDRIAITYAYAAEPLFVLAEYAIEQAHSPESDLGRARKLLARGLEIDDELGPLHGGMGYSYILEGRWRSRSGLMPDAALADADRLLARAAELEPGNAVASERRVQVAALRAESHLARNRPIRDLIDRGLEQAARAIEINSASSDARAWQGVLWLLLARSSPDDEERNELRERGAASLRDAIDRNPGLEKRFETYLEEATGR